MRTEEFEKEVLQEALPVMVDFEAPWCGYCRRLAPAVNRVSEAHRGSLKVVHVDIDGAPQLADRYGVEVIPTLMLFRGGSAVSSAVNPGSQEAIESWLREADAL